MWSILAIGRVVGAGALQVRRAPCSEQTAKMSVHSRGTGYDHTGEVRLVGWFAMRALSQILPIELS